MKKLVTSAILVWFTLVGTASGSDIGSIQWNRENIQKLNSSDKQSVAMFVNELSDNNVAPFTADEITEIQWVDLAGDGRYELAMTDRSGNCCQYLTIYWQGSDGQFRTQTLGEAGKLSETIRDLNGDGKKELILYSYLTSDGYRGGVHPAPMWPKVYRLEGGKYVEASRDFPDFYDQEVVPQLSQQIAEIRRRQRTASSGGAVVAALEMERDKILRILGRDPTAGLAQAREWAKSDNPDVLEDAAVTFRDIGGNEDAARAADAAFKRALARQASTKGGSS